MTLTIEREAPPLQIDACGVVRVAGTRVTLATVVHALKRGQSAPEIVESYPVLALADVYALMAYYLRHQAEVDAYLAEQAQAAEAVRQTTETDSRNQAWRQSLLAQQEKTRFLRQDWADALAAHRYGSVELQHLANNWRG